MRRFSHLILVIAVLVAMTVQIPAATSQQQASTTTSSTTSTVTGPDPTHTFVDFLVQLAPGPVLQATVVDLANNGTSPTGKVHWSDGGASGNFTASGVCVLLSDFSPTPESACHLLYTPAASTTGRTVEITASYGGDATHKPSSGTYSLNVPAGGTESTTTTQGTSITSSGSTTALASTQTSSATTATGGVDFGSSPGLPVQVVPFAIATSFLAGSILLVSRLNLGRMVIRRRAAKIGLVLLSFVILMTLYGLFLDPYPPRAFPCLFSCSGVPPFVNLAHPFGTYATGQDVFSEIAHGAPVDLTIGFEATAVALTIGTLVGLLAGAEKWIVQDMLMAFIQIVLLLPSFAIVVWIYRTYDNTNLFLSPLLTNYLALLLGLFAWPPIALVVRNAVRSLRQEEFVLAAKAIGAGSRRVLFKHILPNVATAVLSVASVVFAANITAESLFAFLGLVNRASDAVTWGYLLWEGDRVLFGEWWVAFFPGLMIVITVLGFALVGDAISEALNPKVAVTESRYGKSAQPRL